jgi:serine phosphatase RsbU (regulator of sigma subunit)
MLEFKDFFHLPQLDPLVDQLVADGPGLVVVAGLDARPLPGSPAAGGFLSSGRSTIFRVLMRQIVEARPILRTIVVARSKDILRLPPKLKSRVEYLLVQGPYTYAGRLNEAIRRRPGLLVIDQMGTETAGLALEAAHQGLWVLSQIDTIFHGAEVAWALLDLGAAREHLGALRWSVTVQRLATLCLHCKQAAPSLPQDLAERLGRYPDLSAGEASTFFQAVGCDKCGYSGYKGEVTVFDVFQASADAPIGQPSLLSQEEYALRLAAAGYLPAEDVLGLETNRLRRTYNLLTANEHALSQANMALQRKLVELEAANRVLQQRTEALLSLHEIGQTLIGASSLDELAQQVCRHAHDLCGADRVALYFLPGEETAEILATSGWAPTADISRMAPASQILTLTTGAEPIPFHEWPPGISPREAKPEVAWWRTGLCVPLIAQGRPVGAMIVHTSQKPAFAPGEVALLQTFAHQAALALQRAGLITTLQNNLAELKAAQAEVVKKERLEQELEVARRVQQSMLPRVFPQVAGYTFAAQNAPARRVGGDFYDVIPLQAQDLGVVIGDVSDKGLPSALYMALTRSLLQAEARRERSPAAVLNNVHRLLLALGTADMFVTVFYGVVDSSTRRLTYARAGHDRPLLLRGGSARPLDGTGIVLGFPDLDHLYLSEEQIDLRPHDRLVLYTDGLTDALNPDGRLFDLTQFISVLQSYARLPPAELCQATFAHLAAYQGNAEQYDDMTMLVVAVE